MKEETGASEPFRKNRNNNGGQSQRCLAPDGGTARPKKMFVVNIETESGLKNGAELFARKQGGTPPPTVRATDNSMPDDPGVFPVDALPLVMREMAEETALVHQIDVALPAMATVATVAGAIGNSVYTEGAVNGWKTSCNLYVVPAAMKSYGKGATSQITKPILDASLRLQTEFNKTGRARLLAEKEVLTQDKKQIMKSMRSGECDDAQMEVLANTISRIEEVKDQLKRQPSYHIGAATGAALEEAFARNDNQLFSVTSEAGDALEIALGRHGQAGMDIYLSGYSGDNVASSRISRGDKNLTPCLTLFWMVQPNLLRDLYSNEAALDRGLTARILAFSVEHDTVPFDDGVDMQIDEKVTEEWAACINRILEGRKSPRTIPVTPGARELFRDWYNESVQLRNGAFRDVGSELGRWRENALRIAGVLAVAAEAKEVDELIAYDAIRICRWCVFNTLDLLESGRNERLQKRTQRLRELLLKGPLSLRDLCKSHGFNKQELRHIADTFDQQFAIEKYKPSGGGRPSDKIRLINSKSKND